MKRITHVNVAWLLDWPRGRLGYLPWNRKARELADTTFNRRPCPVKVDLGKTWKIAEREGQAQKRGKFEMFLDELVDTVIHEYYHVFQPRYTREKRAEAGANLFAMYGRRTRR